MVKYFALIIVSFLLTSCETYQEQNTIWPDTCKACKRKIYTA